MINGLGAFLGPLVILFLGTSSSMGAKISMGIEFIFCLRPDIANTVIFAKLLYRARFAAAVKSTSISLF
jgi:hypothetical protein